MFNGSRDWVRWSLLISVVLVLVGGSVSYAVQSGGGSVSVKHVRFAGTNGKMIDGKLYVPADATNESPAPGVMAVHGYINTRDTMEPLSLELARRGYVVLNVDQMGHGLSDSPAFANGYGGPDSLAYLRSLGFVNDNCIGMVGHSMGGWSSVMAAAAHPRGYSSIVLLGSSTGSGFTAPGSPVFPTNLNVVFDKYDEFSPMMWGVKYAYNINESPKLENVFGVSGSIEEDKLYGSIEAGTGRELDVIDTIHPCLTVSSAANEEVISWFERTLGSPAQSSEQSSVKGQIWPLHEFGSLLTYLGALLFVFPAGALLLRIPFFESLKDKVPDPGGESGKDQWVVFLIGAAVTILTYFHVTQDLKLWVEGLSLFPGSFWPQTVTNGVMMWASVTGVIMLVSFLLWHFVLNRDKGISCNNYGITWSDGVMKWKKIGKSFLLATIVAFLTYFVAWFSDWFFRVSPHFWVFTIKTMTLGDFQVFLCYLIPFLFYFLVFNLYLNGQLRSPERPDSSLRHDLLKNFLVIVVPFVVLILAQYLPRLAGGTLLMAASTTPNYALWGIVAFQFIPLLGFAALVSTYFFRETGRIYTGSFMCAIFVTWLVVASQATTALPF